MCYGKSEVVYAHDNRVILGRYSDPGYRADIYAHYRDTVAAAFFHCLLEEADDEEISLILRAVEEENDSVLYDIVEDEEELRIISKYFEELLEDVELS